MFALPDFFDEKVINHYQLDDGRIWSVKQAKFVEESEVPSDAVIGPCLDQDRHSTIDGLVNSCLKFYGYDLGEFAE